MAQINFEDAISNLELNIRWIEDIPAHQFAGYGNVVMAMRDALELLKKQEAVKPKETAYQRVDHKIAYRYRCGVCDQSIFPSYKFCPFCGQAVKWE